MLQLNKHSFDLKRPLVMGILNITPDSFSDGGMYLDFNAALKRFGFLLHRELVIF